MKTEKEILAEFTALVFESDGSSGLDILSKESLLKGSLTSVRLAANDAVEISSLMSKKAQDELNTKMLTKGLPSLSSIQNRAFRGFMKIANRGSIRKEEEYRMVRSVSETDLLNNDQQSLAYTMIESYETTRT